MRHLANTIDLASFCPPESTTQSGKSIGSAVFAQFMAEVSILYNGCSFLPKLRLPMGDLKPVLTYDSLGRPRTAVDGPREPCIRWGPDPPWEGAILRGKGASHCKV